MNKKTLSLFVVGFGIGIGIFYGGKFLLDKKQPAPDLTHSNSSGQASSPQATPNFVNRKDNLIKVVSPLAFSSISSPVKISGQARGYWFFEASFPVKIIDENGTVLGRDIARAGGDWMVEDFVPFELEINFVKPSTETGFVILEKDNPSGLPENADELRWPVKFLPQRQ